MIEPILNSIIDIEEPEDINDFVMPLTACINELGDEGADLFYFRIMTPQRLMKMLKEDEILEVRAIFVVNKASMEENIKLVELEINKILKKCVRETWEETALAINYYLDWEYYDPSVGICDYYLCSRNLKKQKFYIDIKNNNDEDTLEKY